MHSDADDRYRKRYLELVHEVEAKELAWCDTAEQVQRVLAALIGLARRPPSPELDARLSRLAEETETSFELTGLEKQLTALQELAATTLQPGTELQAWQRIHQILTQLVTRLPLPSKLNPAREQLLTHLAGHGADPDAICAVSEKTVNLVHGVEEQIRSGRRELGAFLLDLTGKLTVLDHGLVSAQGEVEAGFAAAKSSDLAMRDEVRDLEVQARDIAEIEDLRGVMSRAVDSICQHIATRQQEEQVRGARLAGEVEGLQQELTRLQTEVAGYREKNRQAVEASLRDPLTGVYNRLAYMERSQAEYASCQRYHTPLSLLMLDLDQFKKINDSFGHRAGDLVLRQVARMAQDILRETDFLARYGGEEFIVLLPKTPLAAATQVAEKLRQAVDDFRFHHEDKEVPVTLSIGVAELGDGDTIESTLERADQALYRAKGTGRNRCVGENELIRDGS